MIGGGAWPEPTLAPAPRYLGHQPGEGDWGSTDRAVETGSVPPRCGLAVRPRGDPRRRRIDPAGATDLQAKGQRHAIFDSDPDAVLESTPVGGVLLRVSATLAYRELASRTVATVCKMSGRRTATAESAGRFTNELVSAVGEAFNNVVLHAYAEREPGEVELRLRWTDAAVVVEMRDWGQPFDLAAVSEPDLDQGQESGMGVFIIRSFVDEVAYTAGQPNVLTLTKRFPVR
jgi:serine/threonine-protein kinase RsbW